MQSTRYNARGLPDRVTIPYAAGSPGSYAGFDAGKPATQTSYDALGRVTRVQKPDGTTQSTNYVNVWGWTESVDANGHKKWYERDALGRLLTVREYYDATNFWSTSYRYNVLDKLTGVTDAQGTLTSMSYDKLGRKTAMQDPDMGSWSYVYDAVGNLIRTTDARGKTVIYDYDQLNRLRSKQYADGSSAKYLYDGCLPGDPGTCTWENRRGRLWSTVATDGSKWWASFDANGRMSAEWWTAPGIPGYTVYHTYNALDQETTTTYPDDGETIQHEYQGRELTRSYASQLPSGWQALDLRYIYNAQGQPKSIDYNNSSLTARWGYYGYNWAGLGDGDDTPSNWGNSSFGRLWMLDTKAGAASLRNIQLGYDSIGNVNHQVIYEGGAPQDDLFADYDALDRLTALHQGGWTGPLIGHYAYDSVGNLTSKTEGSTTYSMPASGVAPRHAPRNIAVNGVPTTLDYDATGNLIRETGGSNRTLTYDDENRLSSHIDHTTGITTTYYAGKLREYVVDELGPLEWSKYYWFNGQLLGQRTIKSSGGSASRSSLWAMVEGQTDADKKAMRLVSWTPEGVTGSGVASEDQPVVRGSWGSITTPASGSTITTSPLTIRFAGGDVVKVLFWALYEGSWHNLGMDTNGGDGFAVNWDWSSVSNQGVTLTTWVWDAADNLTMDPGGYVHVTLQGAWRLTSPTNGTTITSCPVTLQAWGNGASRVEFHALYDGSWHSLGMDTNGGDGWAVSWNCALVANQSVVLTTWMWDANNNLIMDPGGYVYVTLQGAWRLTSPANGATITSCPLTIQAYASGASRVQFWALYDSTWHDLGTDTNGGDGWQVSWNCTEVSNQSMTLTTWMWDASNNLYMDPGGYVGITLNQPFMGISAPASGSTITASPLPIQFAGTNVSRVQFRAYYDGSWRDLGTDTNGADGWSISWDWSQVANQQVTLTTWVWDAADNLRMDPGGYVYVTLQGAWRLTSPANGATITGCPLNLQAWANGATKVEFLALYDGTWHSLGTDTTPSDGWNISWNCAEVRNQAVTLTTWMWNAGGALIMDPGGYVNITLQGPDWRVTAPTTGATITTCPLTVQAWANGATRTQFWANYDGFAHNLGTDTNGADGWSVLWNCAGVQDQQVTLSISGWDSNNNPVSYPSGTVTVTVDVPLAANVTLYWYVPDHLGGQYLMVDAATSQVVSTRRTYPFGQTRYQSGSSPTDRQFTGQILDQSTGLYYYGARYYSPALGRFVQPDSIVPEPGNPQALNRYAYAKNSPLTHVDSSGHIAFVPLLIAGAFLAWDAYQAHQTFGNPNATNLDKGIAVAAVALDVVPGAGQVAGQVGKTVVKQVVKQTTKEATEQLEKRVVSEAAEGSYFGARGLRSGREFDPGAAGGVIQSLSTKNVRITGKGIDVVEQHLSRFGPDKANQAMVERLRRVAAGELAPTGADMNFYTHELREYVRYRRLGWKTGEPLDPDTARELWNNAHTATLEDYGLREGTGVLYHSSIDIP